MRNGIASAMVSTLIRIDGCLIARTDGRLGPVPYLTNKNAPAWRFGKEQKPFLGKCKDEQLKSLQTIW